MPSQPEWKGPIPSPFRAALTARCPRCGQGRLYKAMLTPDEDCAVCRLDYSFIDSGDGPAVFVILIVGAIIMFLSLMVESAFHPPLWLQAIIWIPVIILASVWALRFLKSLMIAMQYRTGASQHLEIEED